MMIIIVIFPGPADRPGQIIDYNAGTGRGTGRGDGPGDGSGGKGWWWWNNLCNSFISGLTIFSMEVRSSIESVIAKAPANYDQTRDQEVVTNFSNDYKGFLIQYARYAKAE